MSRLRLGGSSSEALHEGFDADQIVQESAERLLGQQSRTTRNAEIKDKQFPPRLSPRAQNKSVDPAVRRANMLTTMPNAAGGSFGQMGKSSFGKKKASVPVLNTNASQDGGRMTSKYNNFALD